MQLSFIGTLLCFIGTLPGIKFGDSVGAYKDERLISIGLFLVSLGLANVLTEKMPATPILWTRALAALGLGLIASIPFFSVANDVFVVFMTIIGFTTYIFITSRKSSP